MSLAQRLRPLLGDLLVIDGAKILAVNIGGAGLAFLSHVLFARWLSVESYGTYVFALSWLNILFIAIQAGLNLSMVRFIAEFRAQKNPAAMRAVLSFSNRVVLALGGVAALLGILAVNLAPAGGSAELRHTLYAALALTVVMALIQQRAALLQGLERVVQATLTLEILRPLLLLAVLFAAMQTVAVDALTIMSANLIVSAAVLVVLAVYARACIRAEPAAGTAAIPPWQGWLRVSLPYVAITGLTVLLSQTDILMIGYLLGPEQAGLYAPAAKVALLVIFPAVAIRARFGPLSAKLFAEDRRADLQERLNVATIVSVIACLGVIAVIVPARSMILALFGDAYVAGTTAVLILTSGYLAYSLFSAAEMFFLVGPFERVNAWIAALTLTLNAILNLFLIPRFGIEGAAAATGVAIACRGATSALVVRKRAGLLPWARHERGEGQS